MPYNDGSLDTCPGNPELINLDKVHRLGDIQTRRDPWDWFRLESGRRAMGVAARSIRASARSDGPDLVRIIGSGARVHSMDIYAHWVLAFKYAKYLSEYAETDLWEWHEEHRILGRPADLGSGHVIGPRTRAYGAGLYGDKIDAFEDNLEIVSLHTVNNLAHTRKVPGIRDRRYPWEWLKRSRHVVEEVNYEIGVAGTELVRILGYGPVEFNAHWLIALKYARYLSKDIEAEVRELYEEHLQSQAVRKETP